MALCVFINTMFKLHVKLNEQLWISQTCPKNIGYFTMNKEKKTVSDFIKIIILYKMELEAF